MLAVFLIQLRLTVLLSIQACGLFVKRKRQVNEKSSVDSKKSGGILLPAVNHVQDGNASRP
jgi:hypothetical protein